MGGGAGALVRSRSFQLGVGHRRHFPEIERIASGEFVAFADGLLRPHLGQVKCVGAPVDMAVPTDFAAQRYYYMMIPKNAAHPNAAKLYVAFMLTPEGQRLMWNSDDTNSSDCSPTPGWRKAVADYEKQGVKFREFTADWARQHPETGRVGRRPGAVQIVTKR